MKIKTKAAHYWISKLLPSLHYRSIKCTRPKTTSHLKISRTYKIFLFSAALLSSQLVSADSSIERVYTNEASSRTTISFESSAPIRHEIFLLSNPDRLVIELGDTTLSSELVKDIRYVGPINSVRTGGTRVVLDLAYALVANSTVHSQTSTSDQVLTVELQHQDVEKEAASKQKLDTLLGAIIVLYHTKGYWVKPELGFDKSGVICREMLANSESALIFERYEREKLFITMRIGGENPVGDSTIIDQINTDLVVPAEFENFEVQDDFVTFDRYTKPENGSLVGSTFELNVVKWELRWVENHTCENCTEEQLTALRVSREDSDEPLIWCKGALD